MRKRLPWVAVLLCAGLAVAVSCRRSDTRAVVIRVPGMADARGIRIATNAALDQVVGQFDGVKHDCEVDMQKRIVLYHESRALLLGSYQRRIESRIRDVGFAARVVAAGPNPSPVIETKDGPFREWPDRFTVAIRAPGMKTHTDANVIVDAIAWARTGDDARIVVDSRARTIAVTYNSVLVSRKNIECAIAAVGLNANEIPARLGEPDALPHGWLPVHL